MDESTKVLGSTSLNLTKMAEAQVKALRSFERDLSTQSANIKVLPPEPATASEDDFPEDLNTMEDHLYNASERSLRPQHPPPTTLPCANVQPSKYKICKDPGTMACSACKLVSYCSKECQNAHWKRHKQDCKNPIRSTDWAPNWVRELRSPSFLVDEPEIDQLPRIQQEEFSGGVSLWGNTPAIDVLNLACMPMEYRLQLSVILKSFFEQRIERPIPLGPRSTLSTWIPKEFLPYFLHLISSSFSIGDIQDEYDRVRSAPSRQDLRDKMYASLRPSHRLAFREYRRFGIILPFGAMNAHFNCPNVSLFSQEGKWLQTDYADPLDGWDVPAIVDTGKAHGAHQEDIYGCLYFFLSKQLRTFASRLRKFSSSFTILAMDASDLPTLIRENEFAEFNIPRSIKFDRIEVSNILDTNYVGLDVVLTLWGPLLHESKGAAIIGYFMNWMGFDKAGRAVTEARGQVFEDLVKKVMEKEKPKFNSKDFMGNFRPAMANCFQ